MSEFRGTQKAQEYAKNKSSSQVFQEQHYLDFLCGYNQALRDWKAPEMFRFLKDSFGLLVRMDAHIKELEKGLGYANEDFMNDMEKLVKEVSEL